MNKQVLRETFLQKRNTLQSEVYNQRNSMLVRNARRYLASVQLDVVHLFLPIIKFREPDLSLLMEELFLSGKKVILPRVDGENLVHLEYGEQSSISPSRWGIPEPKNGAMTAPVEIDVVLIPLAVFDRRGNRLGYGKGYYDRFLQECRPDAVKAGISLGPPLDELPGMESHDVKLDICITPFQVYDFRN